ncbi:YcaO-like family protein [Actinotalea sp. C106]|uniref:YcaO-like family protein n=1 Tax=Actinotalea sp. C106 TaxID=2908644 RepID=UPI0020284457|nr:YcaO-like family protein [Actinotalea sp. C106]
MSIDDLVDPRTGVLLDLAPSPPRADMPSGWTTWGATTGRTTAFAPWRADSYGFGASLGDQAAARGAALGEAIERYCGNAVPERLAVTARSHRDLGGAALDPMRLALYSVTQYRSPGFPFVPFTRDLPVSWVEALDLHTSAETLVPASLAYLDYFHGPRADEPATHSPAYSGIATGTSRPAALRSALEELLERDATGIWWASGAPTHAWDDGGRVTGRLGRPGVGGTVRLRLLEVPRELPTPVVAALVEDETAGVVGFGSACRADHPTAAAKALVEALGGLRLGRDLDDPSSDVWAAVRSGRVESHVYLPHRSDRQYVDDAWSPAAAHPWSSLTDLPPVAQVYLDPRMQASPLQRLRPSAALPLPARQDTRDDSAVVAALLADLGAAGVGAYAVDLTTPDVAACGLHVVRVITPELVGNGPPAFPLHGGRRLYEVPFRLGWVERPLTEADLVTTPLPLA